ncbi:hypothetical protein Q7P35_001074 [Cladosporium inversicolor]
MGSGTVLVDIRSNCKGATGSRQSRCSASKQACKWLSRGAAPGGSGGSFRWGVLGKRAGVTDSKGNGPKPLVFMIATTNAEESRTSKGFVFRLDRAIISMHDVADPELASDTDLGLVQVPCCTSGGSIQSGSRDLEDRDYWTNAPTLKHDTLFQPYRRAHRPINTTSHDQLSVWRKYQYTPNSDTSFADASSQLEASGQSDPGKLKIWQVASQAWTLQEISSYPSHGISSSTISRYTEAKSISTVLGTAHVPPEMKRAISRIVPHEAGAHMVVAMSKTTGTHRKSIPMFRWEFLEFFDTGQGPSGPTSSSWLLPDRHYVTITTQFSSNGYICNLQRKAPSDMM